MCFNHQQFMNAYNAIAAEVHQTATEKGFWETERNDGELIALMHSELSEALEGIRLGFPPDDKIPEFDSVSAELADVIIRIMDYGHALALPIAPALIAKIAMNKTRAYKHGGKKF